MIAISIEWLLDPLFIAFVMICASLLKLAKKQYEHFFTRFIAAVWFCFIWFVPTLDVDTVRVVGRWVFIQPYLIEGISYGLRYYFGKNG